MDDLPKEVQDYLNSSVFLVHQLRQMLRNHNRMLSVTASSGDIASASMLLHNNVALSSIDLLLAFDATKWAKELDPKEGLSMDVN